MFDLVIRNGTVIDGSGAPRRVAEEEIESVNTYAEAALRTAREEA